MVLDRSIQNHRDRWANDNEDNNAAEPPGPGQPVIRQAAKDLARGMIDTDNYTRAALVAAVSDRRRRRGP